MAKNQREIYDNKNGYYTDEELLEFKHMSDEDFINFLRHFNTGIHKCPPVKYKAFSCMRCMDCMKDAREKVKEKKVK